MNSRPKVRSSLVPFKIFSKYLDLIKDMLLTNHLIVTLGGMDVVIKNHNNFSSVVSLFFVFTLYQGKLSSIYMTCPRSLRDIDLT